MQIAFRVDSSTIIGHGHVMRCLTLADALVRVQKNKEINISFITKAHQGNINHLIRNKGYQLELLPIGDKALKQEDSNTWLGCKSEQDATQTITAIKALSPINLLIVDHYAIDKAWHQQVRPFYQQLMVIDDLANRPLDCNVLLDQTLNCQAERYKHFVPEYCHLFLGQNYMLLRDEFVNLREKAKVRREQQSKQLTQANIMITMGGGDPDNLSELALLAIEKLRADFPAITATLVLSSQSKHLESLKQRLRKLPWCRLVTDCQAMADLMLDAYIAIGASGSTAWERCCLGLPCLTTVNAENQQLIAKNLSDAGASINLGWHKDISIKMITIQLQSLLSTPQKYLTMVDRCFSTCDGQGATRVAKALVAKQLTLRSKSNEK